MRAGLRTVGTAVVVSVALAGCDAIFGYAPAAPGAITDAAADLRFTDGGAPSGDGDLGPDALPPTDVVEISVGSAHICVRKADGSLRCWGWNDWGMLGTGDIVGSSAPRPVLDLVDVRQVVASVVHTCALTTGANGERTAHCWGYGGYGALGNGSQSSSSTPIQVDTFTDVAQIAPGHTHTCALRESGDVLCWGRNYYGMLGDGTTTSTVTPVTVAGLADCQVERLVSGINHSCVLCSGGTVRCWGRNSHGEVGDGTTSNALTPQPVVTAGGQSALDGALELWAGNNTTCALRAGGEPVCWGNNADGQLGGPDLGPRTSAEPVYLDTSKTQALRGVRELALGDRHSCALLEPDGRVACWGNNRRGTLGNGTTSDSLYPLPVPGIAQVRQLRGDSAMTCALTLSSVFCWGNNGRGQIGNGDDGRVLTPHKVDGIANAVDVAAGERHSCAVLADGSVYCWGHGVHGQLGDPQARLWHPTPVRVRDASGSGWLANAEQVGVGYSHSCAVAGTSNVYCWGANGNGQLGDGSRTARALPVPMAADAAGTLIASAIEVAAGVRHTCVRKASGEVWCAGSNDAGQLGLDFTVGQALDDVLGPVSSLPTASTLVSGDYTNCIQSGLQLLCWGRDQNGVLGNGPPEADAYLPQAVSLPDTPTALIASAIGRSHACLAYDVGGQGKVICWGSGSHGKLGNGKTSTRDAPIEPVVGIGAAIAIDASPGYGWTGAHSCAATVSGALHCWGWNEYGQLGDGTTDERADAGSAIAGLSGVTDVATGTHHTCAIDGQGDVYCWGYNGDGAVGTGALPLRPSPTRVLGL